MAIIFQYHLYIAEVVLVR